MTFAAELLALAEARATTDCELSRWAAEKSISRVDSAESMRWVLRQAGDDYAVAEKFLTVWDHFTTQGLSPYRMIFAMGRQRRRKLIHVPARAPGGHVWLSSGPVPYVPLRPAAMALHLAAYIAREWS